MEEVSASQQEESTTHAKAKKKYPRNRVKLNDTESAKDFLSKLIYDAQLGDKPIAHFKNLTYMVQVFISTDRLVNEKRELKYLVDKYVSGVWDSVDYKFSKLEKDLKQNFDPSGFDIVNKLITKHREGVREMSDSYKHKAITEIETRQKAVAKNTEFGTADWKLEAIKDLIDSLPEAQFAEILKYSSELKEDRSKENEEEQ